MSDVLPRILVVDDELPLLKAIRETLPQHGYTVVTASTPSEARAHLHRERFDILLTDLNLTETNGVALIAQALAIDPLVMGIVMTGQGSIDSAVSAMKTGAHDYILKPFKLSAALSVFARALATRRLRDENLKLQERLKARTEELEVMNRELEAFSYSVSHDLRSPLRSITGFAEMLQEELGSAQPEPIQDALRHLVRATGRMNHLIDDLLRLARAAREPLRREEVALSDLAGEIAAKLQAGAPGRVVEWRISPVPPAQGDAGLVRIALENLLGNAWKYSSRTPNAWIEFAAEERAGEPPVYRVRDNGAGFDRTHATQLFEPFQRFHSTAEFDGSGLGLATVQRIVQRHGGRIFAESDPGQGATFRFTLDRTAGDVPLPRREESG